MSNRIGRAKPRSMHHEHGASAPSLLGESGGAIPDRLQPAGDLALLATRSAGDAFAPAEAAEFANALRRVLTPPGAGGLVWDEGDEEEDEEDDLFDDEDDDDDDDEDDIDDDFDDLDDEEEDDDDDDEEDDDLFDDDDDDDDDLDDDVEVMAPEVDALLGN